MKFQFPFSIEEIVIENIARNNKMATRIIKQRDLETLFPNEIQRKAFLDIMSGLIMVEPETIKVGLPTGFEFPWSKREEWGEFVEELNEQGFEIIKK